MHILDPNFTSSASVPYLGWQVAFMLCSLFMAALLISLIFLFLFIDRIRKIRCIPNEELVDRKNTIPWHYFDLIGRQLREVIEYTSLVKSADYSAICKHWPRWKNHFAKLKLLPGTKLGR